MMIDVKKRNIIEKYWLNKLSGNVPKIELPLSSKESNNRKIVKDTLKFEFPERTFMNLKRMSNDSDIILFILFLSGLGIVLYKYTGIEDLVVGTLTPIDEESRDKKGKIVFCRNHLSVDVTFREFINQVKDTVIEAFNYGDFSFGGLLQKILAQNKTNSLNIFGVACIYENFQNKSLLLNQFELVFTLKGGKDCLTAEVEYNNHQYSPLLIRNVCKNLLNVFNRLSEIILQSISDIDIVCLEEKKILSEFGNCNYKEASGFLNSPGYKIERLFEEQVEKNPQAAAVIFENFHLSYKELNRRGNRLAGLLREKGVRPNTIVAIMVDRSIEMIIGILGILKAGSGYLPITPDTPLNRVVGMLDDCSVPILLTRSNDMQKNSFIVLQGLKKNRVEVTRTEPAPRISDFNRLAIPDRSLVNYEKYNRYIGQAIVKNRILIQASRGCPYNCAYCYKIWPRKQVARTGHNIFKEIELYYNLGIRNFDIFMLNQREGRRLFELIIKNKLHDIQLFFPNGLRGDLLTKEYIDLMVEAGTVNFALAIETASPRLQQLIDKNLDLEKIQNNIEYICSHYPQIILELFILHGIPTETEDEALLTLDFLKNLNWIHFPYINVLKIYRNTFMEKLALENGVSPGSIERSENMGWNEISDNLPFSRKFSLEYQAEFLNSYILSKERLLHVLPYQMKILSEDEWVQKYDSYLPFDVNGLDDLLRAVEISREELDAEDFRNDSKDSELLRCLNGKIEKCFPAKHFSGSSLRVLLLDLSQYFDTADDMLYDVVEVPLGLMYILTYLNEQLGEKINGKILKSRIDFKNHEALRQQVEEFQPEVIAVRTLSYYKDFFHESISIIRQIGINAPIIAGGPYATVEYETMLQDRNIDLAVLGEGELTFCKLIEAIIENNRKLPDEDVLKKIPGIAFVSKRNKSKEFFTREIIQLDHLEKETAGESYKNLLSVGEPHDMAYVMFTSGSTGKPKGVVVEHKNVVNVQEWFAGHYNLKEGDHVIQLTDYNFDPSVEQIFSTLLHGATLYVTGKELIAENENLFQFINKHQIQIMNFVPSIINDLIQNREKMKSLKAFISGGDKLDNNVKQQVLSMGYRLYNHYGPTETTVDALTAKCLKTGDVTLGKPIANVKCYILDEKSRLVPAGMNGELYISGLGVTRGYLNNPELTKTKFLPDPFGNDGVVFQTGDIVRWLPDGNIEFIGRNDQQIKIRGVRIELGEIETLLKKHEKISEAVVAKIEAPQENSLKREVSLCAYVVCDHELDVNDLREFLSRHLQDFMIPGFFIKLDKFPLTENGKIDRKALRSPGSYIPKMNNDYVPHRNDVEKIMAGIWSRVLGRDRIGIHDDFFKVGGDSIKAIQITARMKEAGYKLSMSDIFKKVTIAELSSMVKSIKKPPEQSIITGDVPLVPIQLEFFENIKKYPHHFNQSVRLYSRQSRWLPPPPPAPSGHPSQEGNTGRSLRVLSRIPLPRRGGCQADVVG